MIKIKLGKWDYTLHDDQTLTGTFAGMPVQVSYEKNPDPSPHPIRDALLGALPYLVGLIMGTLAAGWIL